MVVPTAEKQEIVSYVTDNHKTLRLVPIPPVPLELIQSNHSLTSEDVMCSIVFQHYMRPTLRVRMLKHSSDEVF